MFDFCTSNTLVLLSFVSANVGVHEFAMTIYLGKYQDHRSNDGESYAQILVLLGIERH